MEPTAGHCRDLLKSLQARIKSLLEAGHFKAAWDLRDELAWLTSIACKRRS